MNDHARRILYVQYTNPAGYPSLEHSARLLADKGWDVLFLGTVAPYDVMRFREHPRITTRYLNFQPRGIRQKIHFLRFCVWAAVQARAWQPGWIYASDLLATPAAMLVRATCGAHVVYHEHDTPAPVTSAWMRGNFRARKSLAAYAAVCVLPNAERAERFARESGAKVQCVWNCPSREEVPPVRVRAQDDSLWLFYHGSLVPARLPLTIVDALAQLPSNVKLRIVGYETVGHAAYMQELLARAEERGVRARIESVGAVATRADLLRWCGTGDVGLALMPLQSGEVNERTMTGASNKPFDYLACGLPLIVSDLPDWRALYVDNGFARICDPSDVSSIVGAVQWYLAHPDERRMMGERGRAKILDEWNYETQFAPVLNLMEQQ